MIDQIKWYLINVGLKKYAPVGIMAGLTALGTFMAAHAGLLEQWGVTYGTWPFSWPAGQGPSGPCILIELDTTGQAVIALVATLVAMMARATEHHALGTPVVEGGQRASDPPKAA